MGVKLITHLPSGADIKKGWSRTSPFPVDHDFTA